MNYYEHHLGDWAAATGHLTWDEDMAYTRLLRAYYHHERAIPEGQQYRLAKASTPAHRKAVDQVLSEFFTISNGAYVQRRAEAEIERYLDKQRKAKASADARWSHTARNAHAMRTHTEGNALQTPDTRHQIPKQSAGESAAPPPSSPPVVEVSGHEPTAAGLLCRAIKAAGIADVNPGHPGLLRLMAAQIPTETFTAAAAALADRNKGRFALLLSTVEGQWNDAQAAGQVSEAKAVDPWATRGGVEGIAKTLGMPKWDECCTFDVYFGRVRKAFEDEQRGSA